MKKRIKKIYIFILLLILFTPKAVGAVACDYVTNVINQYYDIRDELEQIDCENTSESEEVTFCNEKNTRKALLLGKIFKYNDEVKDCNNAELAKIVEENKGECKNLFGTTLTDVRKTVMNFFYITAPFLLLIFGSLDFFKIVVEHDEKQMKALRGRFVKRLIALALLLISPVLINVVVNWNLSKYSLNGNVYTCNTPYAFSIKTWNSTYIPPVTTSSSVGGSGSNTENSNLGVSSNNGLFNIREGSDANPMLEKNNSYYDTSASNTYQCVWYARSRAIEALSTSNDSERVKKVNTLSNSRGNGWVWYALSVPGEQSATRDTESSGTLDSLVGFQNSSDYTKPRAGSLISWQWTDSRCVAYHNNASGACYGHVAFVEDVDTANNKVLISDGWKSGSSFGFRSEWYDFDYVQSFGGNYVFQGYVYLFEPLTN